MFFSHQRSSPVRPVCDQQDKDRECSRAQPESRPSARYGGSASFPDPTPSMDSPSPPRLHSSPHAPPSFKQYRQNHQGNRDRLSTSCRLFASQPIFHKSPRPLATESPGNHARKFQCRNPITITK